MRIGAFIKSYHSTHYLPLVLEQYRWVDKIVVLNYRFNSVEPTSDNTREICEAFNHPNLICESGEGLNQAQIHNRGVELLKDCDLAWVSDADEIIFPADQKIILDEVKNKDWAGCCRIVDYNGDIYHAMPDRGYTVVIVSPKSERVEFVNLRCLHTSCHHHNIPNATMHHLGLVFPKDVIEWKADWECKEEGQTKESLISDWKFKRDVVPPPELVKLLKNKDTVVYATGCFDLFHYGHLQYLEKAKQYGDKLIVGVNTDETIKKHKGYFPVIPFKQRLAVVNSLKCVDSVVTQEDGDATTTLSKLYKEGLNIKVFARGDSKDWGSDIVKKNGGRIIRIPYFHEISSTDIKNKISKEWESK